MASPYHLTQTSDLVIWITFVCGDVNFLATIPNGLPPAEAEQASRRVESEWLYDNLCSCGWIRRDRAAIRISGEPRHRGRLNLLAGFLERSVG